MKRCPQCGAEYDNHVEYCFVDGTELSQLRTSAATPLIPPPAIPPKRSRMLPLMLVGVIVVIATPLVAFAIYAAIDPTPLAIADPPPRLQAPDPEPRRGTATAVTLVRVESIPPGAEVWEEQTQLCESTPCVIEQPDHAPAQRTLLLKMVGYAPTSAELFKSDGVLQVAMRTVRRILPAPIPQPPSPLNPELVPPPTTGADPLIQER